jgi:hypothetical protein
VQLTVRVGTGNHVPRAGYRVTASQESPFEAVQPPLPPSYLAGWKLSSAISLHSSHSSSLYSPSEDRSALCSPELDIQELLAGLKSIEGWPDGQHLPTGCIYRRSTPRISGYEAFLITRLHPVRCSGFGQRACRYDAYLWVWVVLRQLKHYQKLQRTELSRFWTMSRGVLSQ